MIRKFIIALVILIAANAHGEDYTIVYTGQIGYETRLIGKDDTVIIVHTYEKVYRMGMPYKMYKVFVDGKWIEYFVKS